MKSLCIIVDSTALARARGSETREYDRLETKEKGKKEPLHVEQEAQNQGTKKSLRPQKEEKHLKQPVEEEV